MPELYTFVTARTTDIEVLNEIKESLNDLEIPFTEHKVDDGKAGSFLSGYNWEEDCGFPVELTMAFSAVNLTCVYCNFEFEQGVLNPYKKDKKLP